MAKKIYQSEMLSNIKSDNFNNNDFVYYVLRLVFTGRRRIVLAENSVMYSDCFGSVLNLYVYDFLERNSISFFVEHRPSKSYFDSPILHIYSRIYDENNNIVRSR